MVPKGAGEPVDQLGTALCSPLMVGAATYLSVCSLGRPCLQPWREVGRSLLRPEMGRYLPWGGVSHPNKGNVNQREASEYTMTENTAFPRCRPELEGVDSLGNGRELSAILHPLTSPQGKSKGLIKVVFNCHTARREFGLAFWLSSSGTVFTNACVWA